MRMFRKLALGLALAAAIVPMQAVPASAAGGPYAYVMRVDSAATDCTTFASTIGTTYAVTISGVYLPWGLGGPSGSMPIFADAFYQSLDGGLSWSNFGDTGIMINGVHPAAPAFNTAHRYTVYVTGNGYPLCFFFHSGRYDDNYGALLIEVSL